MPEISADNHLTSPDGVRPESLQPPPQNISVRNGTLAPSVYNPVTLWAAASFGAILGFSRLAFGLLLPAMRADLGGNYSNYGYAQTANFVGYLMGTLLLPAILNRYPHRDRLALIALLTMNAGMLSTATSQDLWQLSLWRLIIGFTAALATVLVLTLAIEAVDIRSRGRASALVWSGAPLGITISGLIAPVALGTGASFAWRMAWVAMGLLGLGATFGYIKALRRHLVNASSNLPVSDASTPPAPRVKTFSILHLLLTPRALLFVTLAYFCFGMGYIIGPTYFISLLVSQGMPSIWTGPVWAVGGFIGVFSSTLWGRATDRYPAGWVLTISMFTAAVSTLLMATGSLWMQLPGNLIMGTCLVGPPLIVTVVLRSQLSGPNYTAGFSLLTAIFAVGQIIGPVVGGLVSDVAGLSVGIIVGAGLLGAGGLFSVLYLISRKPKGVKL